MLNRKIKQYIAKILILALIFSSNAVSCFAESVENFAEEYNQEENVTTAYNTDEFESETDETEVDETEIDETEIDETETDETETDETEEEFELEEAETEIEESEQKEDEIETDEIEPASESEIIDEAPEGELLDEDIFDDLFEISAPQTVTLDFGFGPQFDKSTNWAGLDDAIAIFDHTSGTTTYSINGMSGDLIKDKFSGTTYPNISYGSGEHITLPTFDMTDNAVWEGYKFVCWEDDEGKNLTSEQNGTFLFAFQNTGDITYTAHWEKVDNTYDLHYAFVSERTSTQSTIFEETTTTTLHRTNVYIQPSPIPGFIIDKVSPRINGAELSTNPLDALKTLSYNGVDYLDMSSEDISVDASTFEVQGAMPNHDLDINICYKPDPSQKYKFTINYLNIADDTQIRPQNVQYLNVETLLDYKPLELDNYQYEYAEVDCGPRSIITHSYELGFLTFTGQILNPTDKTDTSNNQGRFYTLMPNQELTLTYKYSLISDHAEITVNKHFEQRDGSFVVDTNVINLMPSAGEITGSFVLENKEDEGYGAPTVTLDNPTDNPTLYVVSYLYNAGIGGEDGEYKFYTSNYANRIIDVVYNYDYSSPYWGQVEYYAYNTPDSHGYIQAASGSVPLSSRYFKRGTYTISDLLEDVDIVPEENYMHVIYKNNSTTPGPILPTYEIDSTVDLGTVLSFFINFEEDPDKWMDIYFTAAPFCTITGTDSVHVSKDTPIASISFPTVTTELGYIHVGGYWQDESGNILVDPLSAITESYITCSPVVISVIGEYGGAVKPLVYTEYNSNGRGTAKLYTKYQTREYILTDRNEKIISIKFGSELNDGFTNLYPGTTYHLYELLPGTLHPSVGNIMVSGDGISEKCVFGIDSVGNNYSYNESNLKISITPVQGVSYALLDDKYNIAHNWTTVPQFSNLVNGTYYLIVAKQTSDVINANDENVIRNGKVVFTEKADLSTRYSRLILIGENAIAINMNDIASERSGTGINAKKVYLLQSDKTVTLKGNINGKWEVCSENTTLTSMTSKMPSSFVMTNEDTIIRNSTESSLSKHKAEYYTTGTKMTFLHENDILAKLNEDTDITNAIENNATVKHYVVISKRPTAKSLVSTLDSKIAPYEYAVDVISEVNGNPYPNSKISDPNLDLSVYVTLEESVVGNKGYEPTNGTFSPLYTTTIDTDIGSGIMSLSGIENVALKYEKIHNIEIKRILNNSIDDSVNDIYYVDDNKKLSESIAEYSTEIQSRFNNYFDMSGVTNENVSTYNAKEYLYDGVYEGVNLFDATNSIIKRNKSIIVKYHLNEERENNKELLSIEINKAIDKQNALVTESLKNTLALAIIDAKNIKNFQKDYTVDEIKNKYETLHDLVLNTNDPPEAVEIILDANGGTLSDNTIIVYKGNASIYATLSNIIKSKEGYSFSSWNTEIDGSGTVITPNSIVGNEPPSILYAIWQVVNNNNNSSLSGNSRSGGGGGGGGGRAAAQVGDQVLTNPVLENPLEYNKKVISMDTAFPGFTNSVIYSDEKVHPYYIYDQFNNVMSLHFIDTENNEPMTNQWFTYERHLGNELRYQTHLLNAAGEALTGFQLVDNTLYYLNENEGEHYSTLKTGWIHDEKDDKWFYASSVTGAILTGWQNIDGKDYYFVNNRTKGEDGKEYITENDVKNDFGVMLKSCVTPDGYKLDDDGARIIIKP